MDFKSLFANTHNECGYSKAACFASQDSNFLVDVGIPNLAPLLSFFGEISRL